MRELLALQTASLVCYVTTMALFMLTVFTDLRVGALSLPTFIAATLFSVAFRQRLRRTVAAPDG
jgi:hypothetical protein